MIDVAQRPAGVRPALDRWAVTRVVLALTWVALYVVAKVAWRPTGDVADGMVTATLLDRVVTDGLLLVGLAAVVGQLVCLCWAPTSWRATRWAWFWLSATPVGALAFLLLSGPFPGVPAPQDPTRRLSGGWAFLIAAVLASGIGLTW